MMRFFSISALLLMVLTLPVFSQDKNVLARIEYEEAESFYAAGKYKSTLASLQRAEDFLKSSNSRILYLRILAFRDWKLQEHGRNVQRYEVLIKDQLGALDSVRAYCDDYLRLYSSSAPEDKVREVYNCLKDTRSMTDRVTAVQSRLSREKERLLRVHKTSKEKKISVDPQLASRLNDLINGWTMDADLKEQAKKFQREGNRPYRDFIAAFGKQPLLKYLWYPITTGLSKNIGERSYYHKGLLFSPDYTVKKAKPLDIRTTFSDNENSITLSKKNPHEFLLTDFLITDAAGKLQGVYYKIVSSGKGDYFLQWMGLAPHEKVDIQRGKIRQTTQAWYAGDMVIQYGFASYPDLKTTFESDKEYSYVLLMHHQPARAKVEHTPVMIDGELYYLDFSDMAEVL